MLSADKQFSQEDTNMEIDLQSALTTKSSSIVKTMMNVPGGRLLQIELDNFKSYPGTQLIGPFWLDDETDKENQKSSSTTSSYSLLTCIIGPNGAGKSNLMDAISFVLGINSLPLRSNNLGELVYRPPIDLTAISSTRSRGPQRATVSAYYQEIDSKASKDEKGRVVVLSRSVNVAGVSEYRLNGRPVPWAEYNAYLESQNILIKARNFLVFQGDVEAVASKSPKDLCRLIEQIAGSDDLKQPYEQAKSESEKTAEAAALALDQRRAVAQEMRSIKQQKEEVAKYEQIQANRDTLRLEHALWKLFHLDQAMREETESENHTINADNAREEQEWRLTDAAHQTSRRALAKLQKDALAQDKRVKRARADYEKQSPEALELTEKQRLLQKKQEQTGVQIENLKGQIDQSQQESIQLKAELEALDQTRTVFEQNAEAQLQQAQLTPSLLAEYTNLKQQVLEASIREQLAKQTLERSHAPTLTTRKQLEDKVQELGLRQAQAESDLRELTAKQKSLQIDISKIDQQLKITQEEEAMVQARARQLQQEQTEVNTRLRFASERLLTARAEQEASEREQRSQGLLEHLKKVFTGIHGRVVDLLHPVNRKYDQAIQTLVGRHLDSIVVDQQRVAIDCIKYLRENRLGSATFLPLDNISNSTRSSTNNLPALPSGCKRAVELIRHEALYDSVVKFVCSQAVVCDNLAIARVLIYDRGVRVKAVTLDGSIIHKSGLLTGGQITSNNNNRGSSRWEERDLTEARNEREQCASRLVELQRAIKHLLHQPGSMDRHSRLSELLSQRKILVEELTLVDSKISTLKAKLVELGDLLIREREALTQTVLALEPFDAQLASLQASIDDHQERIFSEFCEMVGIADIRLYEESRVTLAETLAAKRLELVSAQARLKARIEFLEQHLEDLKSVQLIRAHEILRETDRGIQEISQQLVQIEANRSNYKIALEEALEEQRRLRNAVDEETRTMATHRRAAMKAQQVLDQKLAEREAILAERDKLRELFAGVVRQAKLDDLDLPLVSSKQRNRIQSIADVPLDVSVDQLCVLPIDYARLSRDARVHSDEPWEHARYTQPLQELAQTLDTLAPNIRALDKLRATEARLQESLDQFEEARVQAKRSKEAFDKVRSERKSKFYAAFGPISQTINSIYNQLSRGGTDPLTSSTPAAIITVENEDEPYLEGIRYVAMPPGKPRPMPMDQLSGGERTMAALALLFALHAHRPAPFFILDEVDAALDPQNVHRLTRFLTLAREHENKSSSVVKSSSPISTQFIVISLKPSLYECADALVGIYRDNEAPADCRGSRVLTLKLSDYE